MSRIGKQSIAVPPKVTVKLERQKISVDGPNKIAEMFLNGQLIYYENSNNWWLFRNRIRDS